MTVEIESLNRALAFGCFQFPALLDKDDEFDSTRYVAAVARALEESAGIDNVVVHCDEDDAFKTTMPAPPPSIRESGGPFPLLSFFELAFDLRIPFRLQETLGPGPVSHVGTETFHVELNGYEMPVTTVELIDASDAADPSRAVALVREFLEREIERSKQTEIGFEALGPSPAIPTTTW